MINRILSILLLGVSIFISSCSILFNSPQEIDVSSDPRMQHLVGHWFQLKQHAFLYQYNDTKTYALDVPGYKSSLPASINCYLRDPLNWQNTDWNAKIRQGASNGYLKHKVIAVIPKGIKLYVSQVLEKQTDYDSIVYVIAYIDQPEYTSLPVDIHFLLKSNFGRIVIPYPEDPELTCMGREITPYPNQEYIDYYDPDQAVE